MKRFLACALAGLTLLTVAGARADTPPALTDVLAKVSPEAPPTSVQPSAVAGLYEVIFGSTVYYFSADGKHMLGGPLVELASRRNLSAAALQKVEREQLMPQRVAFLRAAARRRRHRVRRRQAAAPRYRVHRHRLRLLPRAAPPRGSVQRGRDQRALRGLPARRRGLGVVQEGRERLVRRRPQGRADRCQGRQDRPRQGVRKPGGRAVPRRREDSACPARRPSCSTTVACCPATCRRTNSSACWTNRPAESTGATSARRVDSRAVPAACTAGQRRGRVAR